MKKIKLTEAQMDQVLENLLSESKLGDKAWDIAKKYYPYLTEPRESPSGQQFKPLLNKSHVEHIADILNQYQAYSTHALNWILLLMTGNNATTAQVSTIYEDLDLYARYIRKFDENKKKIIAAGGKPDLWSQSGNDKVLNYKNKQELYNIIQPYLSAKEASGGDLIYPMVKHYVQSGDFEFVGETSTWYIVKVLNGHDDAVIDIQRGPSPEDKKEYTKWCTRVAGTYFNNYMKQAPLFMLINKNTAKTTNRESDPKSMLQFHWGRSLQFRDREDNAYDSTGNATLLTDFWKDYPDVYPIFFQGVIDVITDEDLTPIFPINIEKSTLPDDLKAFYKYKIERKIKPEMARIFNTTEERVNIYEYAQHGIMFDVKHGKKYDTVLGRHVPITDSFILKTEQNAINVIDGLKMSIKMLSTINGILVKHQLVTWAPYIDRGKLKEFLKGYDSFQDMDLLYNLRKMLITDASVTDFMREVQKQIDKGNKSAEALVDDLSTSEDIINKSVVIDMITNPQRSDLGLQIIETNIVLDVYSSPNFSEIGLSLDNFKEHSKKTKMSALKTGKIK